MVGIADNKVLVVKEGFLQHLVVVFRKHIELPAVMQEACAALGNISFHGQWKYKSGNWGVWY